MSKQTESPVIQLLGLVWKHECTGTPHSWERINYSMSQALYLCVGAGLPFEADDFQAVFKQFGGGYWFHGEHVYQMAVATNNLSTCQAYEQWRGRPPFIADEVEPPYCAHKGYSHLTAARKRGRLAVGFTFRYGTERPKVTSFAADGSNVVACTYHARKFGDGSQAKIKNRYTLTPADIQRDRAERKRRDIIWDELGRLAPVITMTRLKAIGVTARAEFDACPLDKLEDVLREVKEAAKAGGDT